MKTLIGHTSPETALVIDDYPYGYTLRCKIRYWIEHKPKFGFRFVSQTTNPKREGHPWNKPKKSTYASVGVMLTREDGHIFWMGLGLYPSTETVEAFWVDHGAEIEGTEAGKVLAILRKVAKGRAERRDEQLYGVARAPGTKDGAVLTEATHDEECMLNCEHCNHRECHHTCCFCGGTMDGERHVDMKWVECDCRLSKVAR